MARLSQFSNHERTAPGVKSVGERFDAITKTDWAEAYADLYRFFRRMPAAPLATVLDDAEYRVQQLRRKTAKGVSHGE